MIDGNNYKQALNLASRVRKEAVALDKLQNGALIGVFGAGIALSLIFGGAWWALASASGCISVYRGVLTYISYKNKVSSQKLQEQKEVVEQLVYLEQAQLPDKYKERLSENLLRNVINVPKEREKAPALLDDKKIN